MNNLEKILSPNAQDVLEFLATNPTLTKPDIGLLAWTYARWQYITETHTTRRNIRGEYTRFFQCLELKWRDFNYSNTTIISEICQKIYEILKAQLPNNQIDSLLQAAKFFNIAYPEIVEVGNGDTEGYDENAPMLWEHFKPYCIYFEYLLGKYQVFDYEWISTAQVLWEHCRWVGNQYEDYFCEKATGYFLAKAVALNPSIPIHYLHLRSQRVRYKDNYHSEMLENDVFIQLNSPLGMTFLYYAQYLHYQLANNELALKYYQKFLDYEPELLPENRFNFKSESAYARMYPPSTQTALTEMGEIYLQNDDLAKAEMFFEQAISLRPNNFQAPYQLLAEVREKQGKHLVKAQLWEQKIETFELSKLKGIQAICWEVHYAPQNQSYYPLDGNYYTRIRVSYPHEYAQKAADFYFISRMYSEAQRMYKKLKQFLKDDIYTNKVS
ncbi:MAG: hypothetical protein SFT93_00860, partial [Rickettsiaceae bacterium]|nr:hypothetical protein [Rickettsiaceae bacterium]